MTDNVVRPQRFAIIIGAMRSGTTSLFEALAQHPEISASREKEPNYFLGEAAWSRGWEWYVGRWNWDSDVHRVALEASTNYSKAGEWPGVPARMASVRGVEFRFIYMIRDPVEQVASTVRHGRYAGWLGSLDDGIPSWMIDIVRYARQLDEYRKHFPRSSICVVTLEEFSQFPDVVLKRLTAFLDVSSEFQFKDLQHRYNTGALYRINPALRIVLSSAMARKLAARILPRRLRHRMRTQVSRLAGTARHEDPPVIDERQRKALLTSLASDIESLRSEYGVDVARYWRPAP